MEVIRGAINDLRNHNDSERYRDHTSHHLNKPDKKDNYINGPQGKWQLNRYKSTILQKLMYLESQPKTRECYRANC
jgi:hypothetical protein